MPDPAPAEHRADQARDGESCRTCRKAFEAGDSVILAIVPAGYEAAYCSVACLRSERADQKGGEA